MGRNVLPDAQFETGLCLVRRTPGLAGGEPHLRRDWHIIGRLDDGTPFLLDYNQAVTNWTCAVNLGDSLRKKILGKLREELRRPATFPDYIVVGESCWGCRCVEERVKVSVHPGRRRCGQR